MPPIPTIHDRVKARHTPEPRDPKLDGEEAAALAAYFANGGSVTRCDRDPALDVEHQWRSPANTTTRRED